MTVSRTFQEIEPRFISSIFVIMGIKADHYYEFISPTFEKRVVRLMTIYIALLRGINVGGKNIIKMADLKRMLETMGLKAERSSFYSVVASAIPSLPTTLRS